MNLFAAFASLRFEEKKENVLGRGGFGVVYRGTFKGNDVAVKVDLIDKKYLDDKGKQEQKREMEEHLRLDHENVLKLLHVDDSRDKTCLVLQLCAGTLTDYCERRYQGPMPRDIIVLYQIANGLHYIHSQNLVHRDVKPDNILISLTTPVQMKLSDFGLVKKTSPWGTYTQRSQLIGLKGTYNYMAPEIHEFWKKVRKLSPDTPSEEIPHGSIQSDTFAAGCVFFFFLTGGKHPFGDYQENDFEILDNIKVNNPIEFNEHIKNLKEGDDRALYELIADMIKPIGQRILLPEVIKQLTTNLISTSRQFKRVARLVRERNIFGSRFHPKKLVIACGIQNEIIFFSAENWSIPFSNWREEEKKFKIGHIKKITTMEWNADGTQLVAVSHEGDVIVWSYPSGEILFQKKISKYKPLARIDWNPFRPNVFATFGGVNIYGDVSFCNSCPVDQRPFHFYTINYNQAIPSFQWISETRIALGLREYGREDGRIEIWEIDESTNSAKYVKRFQHEDGSIVDLAWNERTKCLASCSHGGWMTIWSMDSDQPIHAEKVDGGCWSLAWRSNGKQSDDAGVEAAKKSANNFILVGGLNDGRIVIWTPLAEEKTRILISQHSNRVESLSFSPDGRFLASTDDGKKLIIWSAEDWEPVYEGVGWGERHSWLSSSTDVPDYKLTFNPFQHGKVEVVESAAVV